MKLIKYLISIIILSTFSSSAFAADETIQMLNKQDNERMVYSKKIVKINVGDTVFWKATDKGHNVEFIKGGVPEGVDKFKSKFNKDQNINLQYQEYMLTGALLIKAWE